MSHVTSGMQPVQSAFKEPAGRSSTSRHAGVMHCRCADMCALRQSDTLGSNASVYCAPRCLAVQAALETMQRWDQTEEDAQSHEDKGRMQLKIWILTCFLESKDL